MDSLVCVAFLRELAAIVPVVFPVHPRTAGQLEATREWAALAAEPRIRLVPLQGYHEFLGLLEAAAVAVSDYGGIQEPVIEGCDGCVAEWLVDVLARTWCDP